MTIGRRYGGDVEGYSGDGILFRFGWPQAHDDDAVQAVRAALDIIEAVAVLDDDRRLAMRIGVHSGPAVVGELGGADRRATMAVGRRSTWRPGSRVRRSPAPWWPAPHTVAQVAGRFDVTPLGALDLRGVPNPVEAYRVDGRTAGSQRLGDVLPPDLHRRPRRRARGAAVGLGPGADGSRRAPCW